MADMPPKEILDAALSLEHYFAKRGITRWEFMGVRSRNSDTWTAHRTGKAEGMEAAVSIFSKHYPLTQSNCEALAEINNIIKELRK